MDIKALVVKPKAHSWFCERRSVPFSMKDAVKSELNRLEEMDVLERVTHNNWAAPIVAAPKDGGTV